MSSKRVYLSELPYFLCFHIQLLNFALSQKNIRKMGAAIVHSVE